MSSCSKDDVDIDHANTATDEPIEYALTVDSTNKTEIAQLQIDIEKYLMSSSQQLPLKYPQNVSSMDLLFTVLGGFNKLMTKAKSINCDSIVDYHVKFNSTGIDGAKLVLSGKISIPTSNVPIRGIILVNHITLTDNASAPSNCMQIESLYAELGYAVIFSDYIGLGCTADLPQTFMAEERTAKSTVDLGLAAYDFLKRQGYTFQSATNNVWILGYSQGGAVSLAVQKLIESNYADKFSIQKTLCGGGPYDLDLTYKDLCSSDTTALPLVLAPIVLTGLDYAYSMHTDFSLYFTGNLLKNYKEWIYSKNYSTVDINTAIASTRLSDIFTKETTNYNSELMKPFVELFKKNSLCSWAPKAPIWMYHSIYDNYIPFANTESAIQGFKNNGATATIDTDFNDYGDHLVAGIYFYIKAIDILMY
jgi:pimeloyl-ACP methyl ester carboxylesterase